VHHPLVNEVAAEVRRALAETRVPSYAERAHAGLARYLQVVVERASQRAQVVLIGNCPDPAPFRDALARVTERLGARLHSLWYNANLTRGNAILGPEFLHLHGPASVVEAFGGPAIHYPPGAFGQSNLEVAGRIVEHVRAAVPAGARVAEFYAGVGAIGLSLAGVAGSLVVNELAPASLAGLELGIAGLDAATRARIRVRPGPAADAADAAADAEVVIVDPPRKGLDPGLVDALALAPPPRLLYISCGLEALVDDARRLTAGGALRLAELAAFDLLPYTEHVETVARFERD
jgi:tRNA/tmRNA/rRNA uracil-C5-methylase (TrmA/RlmC/RlmD family)